jgi:glycosidase
MRPTLLLLLTTGSIPAISLATEPNRDITSLSARPSPEWVTGGVMYQIQPRAFTPEGTLKAAAARLPKVADIGVDILYLCPVFVSDDDPSKEGWSPRQRASGMNNPRNPYRMKDYYHVDPAIPLDFWLAARQRLEKIRPDICMLAEGERRADQRNAFDLNYSFTWFNTVRRVHDKGESVSSIRKTWETMAAGRPRGARFIRYIDNHDIANDAFHNRIEEVWGTRRINATLVAIFTLDGVPLLYNGQEVADKARHSIFGRSPIDWASSDTPTGKARYALCTKLCTMRHAERALTGGEVVWLDNDQPDSVLSFLRRIGDEEILSVLNLSPKRRDVCVQLPGWAQQSLGALLANEVEVASRGDLAFDLGSCGYWVGKRRPQ